MLYRVLTDECTLYLLLIDQWRNEMTTLCSVPILPAYVFSSLFTPRNGTLPCGTSIHGELSARVRTDVFRIDDTLDVVGRQTVCSIEMRCPYEPNRLEI